MPQILVIKPFRVQFARGRRGLREFEPGKYELTGEELEHWFVQGVIAQGRAEILPEDQAGSLPGAKVVELVPPGLPADHDAFADAMWTGFDPAKEGSEATAQVTMQGDQVVVVKVTHAPAPAKAAVKKPLAKPKGKGK